MNNPITSIEVFTARNILTNQPETRIKFSRWNTGNKYYIVRSLVRATQITLTMTKLCTAYVQIDPEGYMCSRFEPNTPKPTEDSNPPASCYICPTCHRENEFSSWVLAHWDIRVEHNCFCGAKNYLKQGVLVD